MWTIHGHDSFENSKGENAAVLPTIATSTEYQGRRNRRHSSVPPAWLQMASAGKLALNPALESALRTKVNFTNKEWAAFSISHLHFDDYIMSKIHDVAHSF